MIKLLLFWIAGMYSSYYVSSLYYKQEISLLVAYYIIALIFIVCAGVPYIFRGHKDDS